MSGPEFEHFKTNYYHVEFKLVEQLEYCTSAPVLTLSVCAFFVSADTMSYWTYSFVLQNSYNTMCTFTAQAIKMDVLYI